MKNLYLLCGPPASGKTSWGTNLRDTTPGVSYISRDYIRFSLLDEDDEYFDKEKEVYDTFILIINDLLQGEGDVIADATHLNEKSRNKLLDKLNLENVNIIPVNFCISFDTILERNKQRNGRARVPEYVMYRMYRAWCPANMKEKYKYKEIINIYE